MAGQSWSQIKVQEHASRSAVRSATPAVRDVCFSGYDESSCERDQTILWKNLEYSRTYNCVELEILAVCCLGDFQVPQEEALYGGSQFVLDCVDRLSQQGKKIRRRPWAGGMIRMH